MEREEPSHLTGEGADVHEVGRLWNDDVVLRHGE